MTVDGESVDAVLHAAAGMTDFDVDGFDRLNALLHALLELLLALYRPQTPRQILQSAVLHVAKVRQLR